MDPVLSSTIDFDEYIKSNLHLSGKKSGLSVRPDSKYQNVRQSSEDKERPRSGSTNRPRLDQAKRPASSSSKYDFKDSKDLNDDFFQLNITKYNQTKPALAPSRASSINVRDKHDPSPASPTPPVVLQHSWRAHLTPARPTSALANVASNQSAATNISSHTERQRQLDAYTDEDPDSPLPRTHAYLYRSPAPPLSPNRLSKNSAQWSVPANNLHSHISSSINRSLENSDFSEYKVRLVVLKRCFASWIVYSQGSAERLARWSTDTRENAIYWPKQSCFTWWRMLYRSSKHAHMLRFRRGLQRWYFFHQVQYFCFIFCSSVHLF